MTEPKDVIHTRIWEEEAEPDDPFSAAACYCAGYDVFGDLLGKASWVEYLYLLFKLEPPAPRNARLLEGLALALANPGPRDPSVRAAMNGGVGGSTYASCLMAALAVGAGRLGGAQDVAQAMQMWFSFDTDIEAWTRGLTQPRERIDNEVWPHSEHPPGFDPYARQCPRPVRQTLHYLAACKPGSRLDWLIGHREALESAANCPLSMAGLAAAVFVELELEPRQGEMLYLLLRLPGAGAHALEQERNGWRRFPFFKEALKLENALG